MGAGAGYEIFVKDANGNLVSVKKKADDFGYLVLSAKDANIGAIVRAGEGILVNGDTQILQGDQVVVFCKSQVIRQLEKFFK